MAGVKPHLIVIVGPTAAGKSALAVRLAKKFNGEIISADSRQIYRGLNIGSGQVPGTWQIAKRKAHGVKARKIFIYRGVPHYLVDEADPKRTLTVVEYQTRASRIIRDINARRKLPFLVGGTGFWIDAVAYGLTLPAVPPDLALRRRLARQSSAELWGLLRRLDPERAKTLAPQNPRRLIRAVEIARALGRVPPAEKHPSYRTLWLGLKPPEPILRQKITAFAEHILREGLVAETQKLLRRGVRRNRLTEFGFEYRAALAYLAGRISRSELRATLARDLHRYARRQMAWFKRNPEIRWIKRPGKAEALVRQFIVCPPEYLAPTAVGARMNGGYKQ